MAVRGRAAERFKDRKSPQLHSPNDIVSRARRLIEQAYPSELLPATPTVFESVDGTDGWTVSFEQGVFKYTAAWDQSARSR